MVADAAVVRQEGLPDTGRRRVDGGAVGREVRLRYAYYITCTDFVKDKNGEVVELICEYDSATRGGSSPDGRKVKGTIHWVSAEHAIDATINLYDRLFTHPGPDAAKEGKDYKEYLNPESLRTVTHCIVEPDLAGASPGDRFQFEREGYFCADEKLTRNSTLVFNRTVTLRDSWAKIEQQLKG